MPSDLVVTNTHTSSGDFTVGMMVAAKVIYAYLASRRPARMGFSCSHCVVTA